MHSRSITSAIITAALLSACSSSAAPAPSHTSATSVTSSTSAPSVTSPFKRFRPKPKDSPVIQKVSDVPLSELKIPILVYHHVRKQEGWPKTTWSWKMTVSPEIFEKQMQWISERGYTTIDLDTLVAIFRGEQQPPPKPLVITFDDNNLSQYDVALPVMEKFGIKAVIYLVTHRLTQKGVIDAAMAKDMAARGMDIQSHTLDHATLTNLSINRLDEELLGSKKVLEDLIGKPVRHVAYPSTAQNKTVRERTKAAGYTTGTIMDPRPATVKDDLFKLPRIMITDDTDMKKLLP